METVRFSMKSECEISTTERMAATLHMGKSGAICIDALKMDQINDKLRIYRAIRAFIISVSHYAQGTEHTHAI